MRARDVELLRRLRAACASFEPSALAIARLRCPFCGPSLLVRLNRDEHGVRCMRCGASVIHLSLGVALHAHMPDIAASDVYELSARGPLVAYLRRHARSLIVSEYLPEVPRGTHRNGVGSEDVQCLTFPDASFDLVTHTEVLEHVPDDGRAFRELRRVLRPGGVMLFTVPLHGAERTVERARFRDGATTHLLSPAYHGDPLRAGQRILVYRDYGRDIVGRLAEAGFTRALVHSVGVDFRLIKARNVIVAYAPNR